MALRTGLVIVLVLGATWASDAKDPTKSSSSSSHTTGSDISVLQINHQEFEGEVKTSEVKKKEDMCTLCEELFTEVLDYLKDNSTQTELIDILYKTCSKLPLIEEHCLALVDYYIPLIFSEISSVQPEVLCQYVDLCEEGVTTPKQKSQDKCEICHHAVAEVLLKLKDPDTELEIIELLLKACDAVEDHVKKCKTLVLEYGPLIIENAEQFLENMDLCTIIHACDSSSAGILRKTSLLSVL